MEFLLICNSTSCVRIQHIEDRNLLVGYVAMYMEMYDRAQELFLASSNPIAALEVCPTNVLHVVSKKCLLDQF